MNRDRIKIEIAVDLDAFPGAFHTRESAEEVVLSILLSRIGHYNPIVLPSTD